MEPQIISVTESKALDTAGRLTSVLQVKWKVGNYGPFTVQSNWADLQSGKTLADLRVLASTLSTLPTVS